MAGQHDCVLCGAVGQPYWHACCPRCWYVLPEHVRGPLLACWRRRVIQPAAWAEALAYCLSWRRDRGAVPADD